LEQTRDMLMNQLKDFGWRIEQENKVFLEYFIKL
jgi:hypothetical protein